MNDNKKLIITIAAVALIALIALIAIMVAVKTITADLDLSPVTPAKILTKQQPPNHEEIQHAQQLKELQAWIDRHKDCK